MHKIRLTGGEPLLRHDLPDAGRHAAASALRSPIIALTTNGILLARHAAELRAAGLGRVTVSLDTLRPERMLEFARSARHARYPARDRRGAARPDSRVKLNAVVIRGYNDDEMIDLVEYGRAAGAEVRFIEYMDVGGATGWSMDQVVSRARFSSMLAQRYGPIEPLERR